MSRVEIKKQKFVDAHLAVTQQAADQLGVPVENMMGVSAVESGWGLGSFVLDGPTVAESTNSYFGMHSNANSLQPFSDGVTRIGNTASYVAGYASYDDSLKSFVAKYGSMIQNISDPEEFATILQTQGKFGINNQGKYDPSYIPKLVKTIKGLSQNISYTRSNPL